MIKRYIIVDMETKEPRFVKLDESIFEKGATLEEVKALMRHYDEVR